MQVIARRSPGIAAYFVLLSAIAFAQDRAGEMIEMEARWSDAMRSGDSTTLERLFSDSLVYTHSTGSVMTKQEFLRSFAAGDLRSIEFTDRKVQVFGGTAVVTAEVRFIGGSGNES